MSTPARGHSLGGSGNGMPVSRPYVYKGTERELKGAEKVTEFPSRRRDRSRFPFRQIAEDGGVWKLDPATYGVKAVSIRTAASAWARKNGLRVATEIDGGVIYVQFGKRAGR